MGDTFDLKGCHVIGKSTHIDKLVLSLFVKSLVIIVTNVISTIFAPFLYMIVLIF